MGQRRCMQRTSGGRQLGPGDACVGGSLCRRGRGSRAPLKLCGAMHCEPLGARCPRAELLLNLETPQLARCARRGRALPPHALPT